MFRFQLTCPYSLEQTMRLLSLGPHDPSLQLSGREAKWCLSTPDGPVSIYAESTESQLSVVLHGAGHVWLRPHLSNLFGLADNPCAFRPEYRLVRLHREFQGLHLPRVPLIFPRLVQVVLQQLVSWRDAVRSWRLLCQKYGQPAPGDCGLQLPPSAQRLRTLGYYDLMVCEIRPQQARLILELARRANELEAAATAGAGEFERRLRTVRGIGDWTVQYVLGTALGQADAVLLGDYNLPHTVAWVLAGEPRGTDERMLALLEPYRGHRFRVISMLLQNGERSPRRGPRTNSHRWRFST